MRTAAPRLLPLFRSDLQGRLLALIFAEPDVERSTSELTRTLGASRAGLHRELMRLLEAGILERRHVGRAAVYRAAIASPVFEPLQQLVERTLGVEPQLRSALENLPGLEAAALHGSWARRSLRPDSDIDLLVIGDLGRSEILDQVAEVEERVHRDIDLRVYRRADWERRQEEGSGFTEAVLDRPLVMLFGSLER